MGSPLSIIHDVSWENNLHAWTLGYMAPLGIAEETSASLGTRCLPRGQMGDTAKNCAVFC